MSRTDLVPDPSVHRSSRVSHRVFTAENDRFASNRAANHVLDSRNRRGGEGKAVILLLDFLSNI